MNRYKLDGFIAKLSPQLQACFKIADRVMVSEADTLGDDFQAAATVYNAFVKAAEDYYERHQ